MVSCKKPVSERQLWMLQIYDSRKINSKNIILKFDRRYVILKYSDLTCQE